MLKIRTVITAGLAALALTAAGAATTAAAATHSPPAPLVSEGGGYNFLNVADSLYLHAHADNGVLSDSSTGLQTWQVGPQCNVVGGVTWCMLQLYGGNGYCAEASTQFEAVYLEPCNTGNAYQYFWIKGTGTANHYWFIPYEQSSRFWTDDGFYGHTDHDIILDTAGDGNYAVWQSVCQFQC